jgi:hypothetical protein
MKGFVTVVLGGLALMAVFALAVEYKISREIQHSFARMY